MKRTCSVLVCDEPVKGRGWCKAHYQRWLDKGDPGVTPISKKRPGAPCAVEGCERPRCARGLCKPHYRRWANTGSPGGLEFIAHPLPPEMLTYHATHLRTRAQRGPAADRVCPCGSPAQHWAYQHNDPDPMVDETGLLYSADIFGCYAPMCVRCHSALDREHGQEVIW